jgi:hypothetical protein
MPQRDWRSNFAAVGGIATVLLLGISVAAAQAPKDAGVSEARPAVAGERGQDAGYSQQTPLKPPVPVRVIEDPGQSEHATEREQKSDQHEADGLQAQRDAARAAERSAKAAKGQERAAWWGVRVAAVGTGLLLLSLFFTYRALAIAREDANTARAAVAASEQTAERQLRAYVRVVYDHARYTNIWNVGIQPRAGLTIENVGQTPARNVVIQASMRIADHPLTGPLPPEEIDEHTSRLVVHPRDTFKFRAKLKEPMTAAQIESILRENAAQRIYVYGRVDYADAFGHPRWTTYRLMTDMVDGEVTLMHCAEGNDAS